MGKAYCSRRAAFQDCGAQPTPKRYSRLDRAIVCDSTWTRGVAIPMHSHEKKVVVVFLEDALGSVLWTKMPTGTPVAPFQNTPSCHLVRLPQNATTSIEPRVRRRCYLILVCDAS